MSIEQSSSSEWGVSAGVTTTVGFESGTPAVKGYGEASVGVEYTMS